MARLIDCIESINRLVVGINSTLPTVRSLLFRTGTIASAKEFIQVITQSGFAKLNPV